MKALLSLLLQLAAIHAVSADTLFFEVENTGYKIGAAPGNYLRKCVREKDYLHTWDYNYRNVLVAEGYYSDTSFSTRLLCHKYYHETKGYLLQTRCYDQDVLHGPFITYNPDGDTTDVDLYEQGRLLKAVSLRPSTLDYSETMAQFPGGEKLWADFVNRNVRYPPTVKKELVKGEILVRFLINEEGVIEKAEVLKGLHPLLDEEAIRVIMKSPRWIPGERNGDRVQTSLVQSIYFGL
ncbi:MAG TPA: energy transducer TonB [Chitinophagaceae bacterium]|jgi:TonB family protein|nr:energy transducer TonB [Chitinophagaceae bacterium]